MIHIQSSMCPPKVGIRALQYTLGCAILAGLLTTPALATPAESVLADATGNPTTPSRLAAQRTTYTAALEALRQRKVKHYQKLLLELGDYPLVPYLHYRYLVARLTRHHDPAISRFIQNYRHTHLGQRLHRAWLPVLFRQHRYQKLIDAYFPQDNVTLQCLYLRAHIRLNKFNETLRPLLESVWLHGKSRPKICDPLLDWFRTHGLNEALAWQRIHLSMMDGNTRLARYLKRFLSADNRSWVDLWISLHRNPKRYLQRKRLLSGHPYAPTLIDHGIRRLSRNHPESAQERLLYFKAHNALRIDQVAALHYRVGISAASDGTPQAQAWLDRVPAIHQDDDWRHMQLKLALREGDWRRVLHAAGRLPNHYPFDRMGAYWQARAQERLGNLKDSRQGFRELAGQRGYYGFLAAERLKQDYAFNHIPYPVDLETLRRTRQTPAVARAYEFLFHANLHNAREEWNDLLEQADPITLGHAAVLASHWGWAEGTIRAFGKARAFDDLTRRFPQVYATLFAKQARQHQIDQSLSFAVARRESSFAADTRSPAGAVGLMQLMPSTARKVAGTLKLKRPNTRSLRHPDLNVRLGTRYLADMLKKFGGNPALALAAYNAGPGAVQRWLPKTPIEADIWIDTIPYRETRKYVRTVLEYAAVYRMLFNAPVEPLWPRINPVRPNP